MNQHRFDSHFQQALHRLELFYGPDGQRRKSLRYEDQVLQSEKYFLGNYEKVVDAAGSITKEYHYISCPAGIIGVATRSNEGNFEFQYVLTDHLGSLQALVRENGTLEQEFSFDPWGNPRNPLTWESDTTILPEFQRGFTGHEHLLEFGLINMNGRLYDPSLGRMLSPDNFVQSPGSALGFNRYAYCVNNPLVYTDPSGEIVLSILAAIFAPPLLPFAIAADFGGLMNVTMNAQNITNGYQLLGYYGIGAAAGAASIGAGQLVAGAVGTIGFAGGAMTGAAGGFAGGFVTGAGNAWMGGANFENGICQGLIVGGFGAITGGVIGGLQGGYRARNMDLDYWSGTGISISEMSSESMSPNSKGALTNLSNSQQLTEYTFQNYPNSDEYVQGVFKGVDRFKLAQQKGYYVNNSQMFSPDGAEVHGLTLYVRTSIFGKGSTFIGISPNMISYSNDLHAVLGHELIHAYHYSTGFMARFGMEVSEHYALKFSSSINHSSQYLARITYQSYGNMIPFSHGYIYPPWVPFINY